MQRKIAQSQMTIQLAKPEDLQEIVKVIRETSKWLKAKGILQWSDHFPVSRLEEELLHGELFSVMHHSQKIMETLSLSQRKNEFWPTDDTTATYLNRIAISRDSAGLNLGSEIINWAKESTRKQGASYLRLNCDKANPFLPNFYKECGFHCKGEFYYSPWKMTFYLFEMNV